jgi:hypothetical protein
MFVSHEWIQSIWGLPSDFILSYSPENGNFPISHFTVAMKIAVFSLNAYLWAGRELFFHFTLSCGPESSCFLSYHFSVAQEVAVFLLYVFLWALERAILTSQAFTWY